MASTQPPFNPTGYALLLSPFFTGSPKAPTPTAGDNSNNISTTAFVNNAVNTALLLYTNTSILASTYAPLTSPTFTGSPKGTTATIGDSSTNLATTAFVANNAIPYKNFTSGTFDFNALLTTTVFYNIQDNGGITYANGPSANPLAGNILVMENANANWIT
jgi:hypothetical protein